MSAEKMALFEIVKNSNQAKRFLIDGENFNFKDVIDSSINFFNEWYGFEDRQNNVKDFIQNQKIDDGQISLGEKVLIGGYTITEFTKINDLIRFIAQTVDVSVSVKKDMETKGYTSKENFETLALNSLAVINPFLSEIIEIDKVDRELGGKGFFGGKSFFDYVYFLDEEHNNGYLKKWLEDVMKIKFDDLKVKEIHDLEINIKSKDDKINILEKKVEDLEIKLKDKYNDKEYSDMVDKLSSKDKEIMDLKEQLYKEQSKVDRLTKNPTSDKDLEILKLENEIKQLRKQKDIGYDPDDPYNLCKPYEGGKSRMKVSKPGQRPRDILDGFGMNAQCCATMADGFEKLARSIKSNQFIGQSANIQAVTSVTVTQKNEPIEITKYQVSETIKEIPNIQVSGEPIVIQNIQKETTPTVIPNIQKETQVTKIPNFEQANLDFNKFVEAINKLDSTVKNDLTKSIKNDLVKAVKNVLFSDTTTDTTAKNNLKKVLTTLTKKGSYNAPTNSSGFITGSHTPLELKAMRDKAELQNTNDENNFDIDISDAIAVALVDLFKKQPEHFDMLKEVNKLTRKS